MEHQKIEDGKIKVEKRVYNYIYSAGYKKAITDISEALTTKLNQIEQDGK